MLLPNEIENLAGDLAQDAVNRSYVQSLIPKLAGDRTFWNMMLELMEVALNRRGYVVVRRDQVNMNPPDRHAPWPAAEDTE